MWHAGEANAPTPLSGASARVRIGRADEKLSHQKSAANPAFAFTPGGSRLPPGYFELSKIIRLFAGQLTLIRPLRTRTLAGGQVYLILRCCAPRIPAQIAITTQAVASFLTGSAGFGCSRHLTWGTGARRRRVDCAEST